MVVFELGWWPAAERGVESLRVVDHLDPVGHADSARSLFRWESIAQYSSRAGVAYHAQVQLALPGAQVGDVGYPCLVEFTGVSAAVDPV